MESLLTSLIGLFGTISAVSIAYLALLYEQTKKKSAESREYLIFEIKNSLECCNTITATSLQEGNELRDELIEECQHKSISIEATNKLLELLKGKVSELREKDIETITSDEAGKRAKAAQHIQKYHINDIEKALLKYETAKIFYDKFPIRSKFSIGVPFSLSSIFIAIYPWSNNIEEKLGGNIYSVGIVIISLIGLIWIYKLILSTLLDLRSSN